VALAIFLKGLTYTVILLYKKGEELCIHNYRHVSLQTFSEIFEEVTCKRVSNFLN
jgi:hypothetical protein